MRHRIFIRNMVSDCCRAVVRKELYNIGLIPYEVALGRAELALPPTENQCKQLQAVLLEYGLELTTDHKSKMISQIKQLIIKAHCSQQEKMNVNFSDYLTSIIHKSYNYLSSLFLEVEGITIQKFIIQQKIKRVKELLIYDELSISEIAYQIGYSSAAHLSNQFKAITGLTPSDFRKRETYNENLKFSRRGSVRQHSLRTESVSGYHAEMHQVGA